MLTPPIPTRGLCGFQGYSVGFGGGGGGKGYDVRFVQSVARGRLHGQCHDLPQDMTN